MSGAQSMISIYIYNDPALGNTRVVKERSKVLFFVVVYICRHLESELSRLKHKDPLRTFEIPEIDIIFQESGIMAVHL